MFTTADRPGGTWYLILLGALAIVIMLFAPKGIWGYLVQRYNVAIFPIRRRLVANAPIDADGPQRPAPRLPEAAPRPAPKPWYSEDIPVSAWGGIRLTRE
jgi:hypothetical protein